MRFLNYIIKLPNRTMEELFPGIERNKETTLANQFIEDMENIFNVAEFKHAVYQFK